MNDPYEKGHALARKKLDSTKETVDYDDAFDMIADAYVEGAIDSNGGNPKIKIINPDFWKCKNCIHFDQATSEGGNSPIGRCLKALKLGEYVYQPEQISKYAENAKLIPTSLISPENEAWVGIDFGCIKFESK